MSTGAIELPLFPLKVVLFPGMVLPLHIFEPRYRLMITECRNEHKTFGIVLARPGSKVMHEETYAVGTTVEIREIDELEDGRFILMAIGMQRFRILSWHRKKPYLCGLVEPYQDVPEPPQVLASSAKQAQTLFESYLNMLLEASGKETMEISLPALPEELSYFIAYLLGAEDEKKQQLLELTSTLQRLQEEIAILRREVPFMRKMLVGDSSFADHPDPRMLN